MCIRISKICIAESYLIVRTYHNLLIHSLLDGQLKCCQVLLTIIKAAMKIIAQVLLCIYVFIFLVKYLGGELLGHRVNMSVTL